MKPSIESRSNRTKWKQLRYGLVTILTSIGVLSSPGCIKTNSSGSAAPGVTTHNLPAGSTFVKIVAIDGRRAAPSNNSVALYRGESIHLVARLFDINGVDLGAPSSDFVWSANDDSYDVCDVALPAECERNSNFRITRDGVEFVLSDRDSSDVTIFVESKEPSSVDQNGQPLFDTVFVDNLGFVPSNPMPRPIPRPMPYPEPPRPIRPMPQPMPEPYPMPPPPPRREPIPYPYPAPAPMPPPERPMPRPMPEPYPVQPQPPPRREPIPYPTPAPTPPPERPMPRPMPEPSPAQPPPRHEPAPAPAPSPAPTPIRPMPRH